MRDFRKNKSVLWLWFFMTLSVSFMYFFFQHWYFSVSLGNWQINNNKKTTRLDISYFVFQIPESKHQYSWFNFLVRVFSNRPCRRDCRGCRALTVKSRRAFVVVWPLVSDHHHWRTVKSCVWPSLCFPSVCPGNFPPFLPITARPLNTTHAQINIVFCTKRVGLHIWVRLKDSEHTTPPDG